MLLFIIRFLIFPSCGFGFFFFFLVFIGKFGSGVGSSGPSGDNSIGFSVMKKENFSCPLIPMI